MYPLPNTRIHTVRRLTRALATTIAALDLALTWDDDHDGSLSNDYLTLEHTMLTSSPDLVDPGPLATTNRVLIWLYTSCQLHLERNAAPASPP